MADEIDLERGDPTELGPRSRRRRSTKTDKPPDTPPPRDEGALESEIRGKLERTFDRIVKARRAREDEELASIVEEDAEAMTQGFLSVTHAIPGLRLPFVMLLNIVEPVLAFNRVARLLFIRFVTRRQRRAEEAAAAAEYAEQHPEEFQPAT